MKKDYKKSLNEELKATNSERLNNKIKTLNESLKSLKSCTKNSLPTTIRWLEIQEELWIS